MGDLVSKLFDLLEESNAAVTRVRFSDCGDGRDRLIIAVLGTDEVNIIEDAIKDIEESWNG